MAYQRARSFRKVVRRELGSRVYYEFLVDCNSILKSFASPSILFFICIAHDVLQKEN